MNKILTVGRQAANDIIIDQEEVSRLHVRIGYNADGSMYLEDSSTNGTTVNGIRVQNSRMNISPGDDIRLAGKFPVYWSDIENILKSVKAGSKFPQYILPLVLILTALGLTGRLLYQNVWSDNIANSPQPSISNPSSTGGSTGSGIGYLTPEESDSLNAEEKRLQAERDAAIKAEEERKKKYLRQEEEIKRLQEEVANSDDEKARAVAKAELKAKEDKQKAIEREREKAEKERRERERKQAEIDRKRKEEERVSEPKDARPGTDGNPPSGSAQSPADENIDYLRQFGFLYSDVSAAAETARRLTKNKDISEQEKADYKEGKKQLDDLAEDITKIYHPGKKKFKTDDTNQIKSEYNRILQIFDTVRKGLSL